MTLGLKLTLEIGATPGSLVWTQVMLSDISAGVSSVVTIPMLPYHFSCSKDKCNVKNQYQHNI